MQKIRDGMGRWEDATAEVMRFVTLSKKVKRAASDTSFISKIHGYPYGDAGSRDYQPYGANLTPASLLNRS
jgi:hypothetical protein